MEVERAAFDAASALLGELVAATRGTSATIAVEYDGEVIGWISDGRLDDSLQDGLLGEWQRALGP